MNWWTPPPPPYFFNSGAISNDTQELRKIARSINYELRKRNREENKKKDEKKEPKKTDPKDILAVVGLLSWLGPVIGLLYIKFLTMITTSLVNAVPH